MVNFIHRLFLRYFFILGITTWSVLLCLWTENTKAQESTKKPEPTENQGAPDPLLWAASVDQSALEAKFSFINGLSIWTDIKTNQQRWLDLGNRIGAVSFMRFFPQSGFLFQSRLLREPPPPGDLPPPPDSPQGAPINAMVLEQGQKLSLVSWNQGKKTTIGTWPKPQAEMKKPEDLLDFLRTKLGYDAVVLDEQGPFILVGFILSPKEEGQGLLLSNSDQNLIIGAKNPKGKALLQVLRINGGYGVLEILLNKDKKLPTPLGSKVLLGRSNSH